MFLDLTCFVVENALSHKYDVFPNIRCIFSAKSFCLGNPSLLSSLRQMHSRQRTSGHRRNKGYPDRRHSGAIVADRTF